MTDDDKRFRAGARIMELETLVVHLADRLAICSRLLGQCAERGRIDPAVLRERRERRAGK